MTIKRLIILLVLLMLSASVHAQRFNQNKIHDSQRNRNWEVGMLLQYQTGSSNDFQEGSSIDIDSSLGWGFGLGWNWTEKWNLSYRFSLNKPNYTAVIVPDEGEAQTLDYTMSKYSHQFNVTYNFMKGPLTPYIQAGVGWTTLDSNVPEGPPSTGCWWDPWWGYICTTTWSSYKSSQFTYNVGLGVRWDINGAIFLRGSYNRQFISVDNGDLNFDTFTLESGFMW